MGKPCFRPNKKFDLLYFSIDLGLEPLAYKIENVSKNITKVVANYKSVVVGDPDFQVNQRFFKKYLKQYSLNGNYCYKLKKMLLKILVNIIPSKEKRKALKNEYYL